MNAGNGGAMLVRFALPPEAEAIVASGKARTFIVTIDENLDCDGTCTVSHQLGDFEIHALRTEWDEGASPFAGYTGADSCRRLGTGNVLGTGWGTAGEPSTNSRIAEGSDYTATAATTTLAAGATKLTFTVDVAKTKFPERTAGKLAFMVMGVGTALFYGAQRESTAHAPPSLKIQFCKP